MSATAAAPVLRGEMFDLEEITAWISRPLLRSTGLDGEDRGVFLGGEMLRQDREHVELGGHAALIRSHFGPMVAIHLGPGPVFVLMTPEEMPAYLAGNGSLAIDRHTRVDLDRWNARQAARRARA